MRKNGETKNKYDKIYPQTDINDDSNVVSCANFCLDFVAYDGC